MGEEEEDDYEERPEPEPVNYPSSKRNKVAETETYDVFVSYSHREGDWVEKELLPRLDNAGFKVAIDIRLLKPNDNLEVLRQALDASRTCITIFTSNYFKSDYAPNELGYAMQMDIPIFPVLLDNREIIPQEFRRLKYFEFSFVFLGSISPEEAEKRWVNLIDAIHSELGHSTPSNYSNVETNYRPPNKQQPVAQQEAKPSVVKTESGDTLVTESGDPIAIETPAVSQKKTSSRGTENINVDGVAISDAYSVQDLLGYDDYVKALANFIESPKTKKPITIGIDAVWGGGKTSLMHMLERRLGPPQKLKLWQRLNREGEVESSKVILREKIKSRIKEGWDVLFTPKLWKLPWKNRRSYFYTIWFNAWKYDQEESLWAALVLEILDQIRSQLNLGRKLGIAIKLYWHRFKFEDFLLDIFKSLLLVILIAALGFGLLSVVALMSGDTIRNLSTSYLIGRVQVIVGLGAIALIPLAYTVIKDVLGAITSPFNLGLSRYFKEPDYKGKIGFLGQFQKDYKLVIETVTNKGKWPLLIFIDDLDRCAANKAAEVIESINLLLDSEYCVFVIGMDSAMLSRSIQAKYKDIQPFFEGIDYSSRTGLGRHFLEKIIQIDFRIPQPDPKHISEFILAQLGRKSAEPLGTSQVSKKIQTAESLIQAEERAGKTREEAKQEVEVNRPDLSAAIDNAKQAVEKRAFEEYPEVEKAIQEMAAFLDYNPRRIKRFINMYRLQALIAYERGFLETLISLDNLARWVVISMRWPEFINMVVHDSRIVADIKVHILQIENAATSVQKQKEIESIMSMGKYPPSLYPLLTDPDFEKLITSIDGQIGEAQNYLGLNQLFMVQ